MLGPLGREESPGPVKGHRAGGPAVRNRHVGPVTGGAQKRQRIDDDQPKNHPFPVTECRLGGASSRSYAAPPVVVRYPIPSSVHVKKPK